MKDLNIPPKLSKVLEEEGIWESEEFDPLLLTIMEAEHNGKDIISYQVEFSADDELGPINQVLVNHQLKPDGDEWEALFRKFLKARNAGLESKVYGDSESETCVLWTKKRRHFEKLMALLFEWIDAPEDALRNL